MSDEHNKEMRRFYHPIRFTISGTPMASVKAYQGVVENGQVRVRADANLPENAEVYILVVEAANGSPVRMRSPRLVDRSKAADFVKQVVEIEPYLLTADSRGVLGRDVLNHVSIILDGPALRWETTGESRSS